MSGFGTDEVMSEEPPEFTNPGGPKGTGGIPGRVPVESTARFGQTGGTMAPMPTFGESGGPKPDATDDRGLTDTSVATEHPPHVVDNLELNEDPQNPLPESRGLVNTEAKRRLGQDT